MKVLLVGGAGLIGSYLQPALEARGHQTRIIDRRPKLLEHGGAGDHVRNNIYSYSDAEYALLWQPDVVVFLATNAPSKEAAQYSMALTLDPLQALFNTFLAADQRGVKRFIFMSGVSDSMAADDPLEMYWQLGETFIHNMLPATKMESIVLKPSIIYAPGTIDKRDNLLNTLLEAAIKKERVKARFFDRHDYVYITDVVNATIGVVEQGVNELPRELKHSGDYTYYISSGQPPIDTREVIELFNSIARTMKFPLVAADNTSESWNGPVMHYELNDTSSLILLTGVSEQPTKLDLGLRKLMAMELALWPALKET